MCVHTYTVHIYIYMGILYIYMCTVYVYTHTCSGHNDHPKITSFEMDFFHMIQREPTAGDLCRTG